MLFWKIYRNVIPRCACVSVAQRGVSRAIICFSGGYPIRRRCCFPCSVFFFSCRLLCRNTFRWFLTFIPMRSAGINTLRDHRKRDWWEFTIRKRERKNENENENNIYRCVLSSADSCVSVAQAREDEEQAGSRQEEKRDDEVLKECTFLSHPSLSSLLFS